MDRRTFIGQLGRTSAAMAALPVGGFDPRRAGTPRTAPRSTPQSAPPQSGPPIRCGVIGLNHGHIYGLVELLRRHGADIVSVHAQEDDLRAAFVKRYPSVKVGRSEAEVLEDPTIQVIVSAAIPDERAGIGVRAMQHGKDVLADKPGLTTLAQLAEVRRVQAATGRIYSILYGGRLESPAVVRALDLVRAGAIGTVVQTMGLGPHRLNAPSRPAWSFDRARFGGILCDLASHQTDMFLAFTGATQAQVVAAQADNLHHSQYPHFEDFGDAMVRGPGGTGYFRVDWFSPDGLKVFGDSRLTVIGTEGYLEVRATVDLAGRPGGNHLFLVDARETRYVDTAGTPLPFGAQFVADVVNRTETAMTQAHCFLAAELVLQAQAQARPTRLA